MDKARPAFEPGGKLHAFRSVYDGMDTVDAIAAAQTGPADKPLTDITIDSIDIVPYGA